VCPTRMDAELEKLVEAGKLPSKAAEKLDTLKPGTFCLHKSWGFGRVAEWNLLLNQIVIDFTGKKGHPMQLQYAAENLTVIPAEKTEPIQIRAEGISHADELIEAFNQARQPKEQVAALEQIVKFHQQFKEPEKQLQPVIAAVENVATRNQKLHPELTFELVVSRDDLLERFLQLKPTHIGLTLEKLIVDEERRLVSILPKIPAA